MLERLDEGGLKRLQESLADLAPEMIGFTVAFAYGEVYSRPVLDPPTRQAAIIAALTAMGNAVNQLSFHIGGGLNVGLSPREIVEVMLLTTIWSGFPRCLNGLFAAQEVFSALGVQVAPASPGAGSRRERGLRALSAISGQSGQAVLEHLEGISPEMGEFILDYSYGDILSRPVLSDKVKEIASLAAMSALGNMQPQLTVHINAALNVGCSREEIAEVFIQNAVYAGFPAALNALSILRGATQKE